MIYLDHAASSWPKPTQVIDAVVKTLRETGANPGRGSHQMAMTASRIIFQTRVKLAKLLEIKNPNQIIFTKNTTEALNLAIFGYVKPGDHIICTSIEHNSIRRPLEYLNNHHQVKITYLKHDEDGSLNYKDIQRAIQTNTTLMIVTHGSNVLGTIIELNEVKNALQGTSIPILVDAAQTVGSMPISVKDYEIDMMAFPGHKALLGPQGTGGLYVSPNIELKPLLLGGTGSRAEDIQQPKTMPEGYEAGTVNTPGIAGLAAGVDYVMNQMNLVEHHQKENQQITRLMTEIEKLRNMRSYGPSIGVNRCGLLTFTHEKLDASELAFILDQHYQIAVRSGYHCAPMSHQLINTIERGAVRASVGWSTTDQDIDRFIEALHEIDQSV